MATCEYDYTFFKDLVTVWLQASLANRARYLIRDPERKWRPSWDNVLIYVSAYLTTHVGIDGDPRACTSFSLSLFFVANARRSYEERFNAKSTECKNYGRSLICGRPLLIPLQSPRRRTQKDISVAKDGVAGLQGDDDDDHKTIAEVFKVLIKLPVLSLVSTHACSFGVEFAIDNVIGRVFLVKFELDA
ncbi:hypothetical protein M378DRAFT_1038692 [Amanita muscaria Koide BX008]|uniref:Uncharacterized protein n=1 Tax=Amanita muscaria (strain Koide BX008) TaxID=946122 RepID=A0A0C2WUK4_AMAMK|nr:hypothetical protein M378DRAFT_1038692 [Amanita muscaria Koide BX008]